MPGAKRAVIVGFDYFVRFLARLINERSQHWHAQFFSSTHVDTVRALLASRRADAERKRLNRARNRTVEIPTAGSNRRVEDSNERRFRAETELIEAQTKLHLAHAEEHLAHADEARARAEDLRSAL